MFVPRTVIQHSVLILLQTHYSFVSHPYESTWRHRVPSALLQEVCVFKFRDCAQRPVASAFSHAASQCLQLPWDGPLALTKVHFVSQPNYNTSLCILQIELQIWGSERWPTQRRTALEVQVYLLPQTVYWIWTRDSITEEQLLVSISYWLHSTTSRSFFYDSILFDRKGDNVWFYRRQKRCRLPER